ncbi:hypothetical protein FB451DRAFT_1428674 [Mycena latifolia]|nr:hypothetical protein FB451DRAFT_1428674 [Mycena latifolia]
MSGDIGKLTIPVVRYFSVDLFVGTLLSWALFGVLCVQVGIYFTAFPKDRPYSKILVLLVFVLEILATLANTRDTIRIFGAGWGNMDILDEVGWAWFSTPIIGSISAAVGQGFFARRIYIIGQNVYIPALIIALTALQLGAGIWSGIEICLARRFSHLQLQNTNVKPTDTWLAATSACDLLVVSGMSFYLLKSRNPDFRYTNAIVSRIVRMTVETGLLCAVFAIVDFYLFTKCKGTNYHLALCIGLSKVYSNSILLILNSRAHITHGMPPAEMRLNLSDVVFNSGTKVSTRVEINDGGSSVHMDLEATGRED